ncbi:MAG TPA: hypothetical protein VF715_05705 [Thermoleophilaceae bacterium]|jgi:hypothetical protein
MTRVIALALALALAVPLAAGAAGKPKAPSGKWTFVFQGTGSLRVKEKKLTSLSVTPEGASTACGTARIKLKVVHSLTTVTRAGVTNWIVGKPTPKKTDAYQPVKTKFAIDGKIVSGKIRAIWFEGNRTGSAELYFGDCHLDASFNK